MEGAYNRKITVQAGLGKKQDLISKITRVRRVGVMAQVVESCLTHMKPSVQTPVLPKRNKNKNYEKEI
jgi:hypothetical protein